jgi:hypothetical protein
MDARARSAALQGGLLRCPWHCGTQRQRSSVPETISVAKVRGVIAEPVIDGIVLPAPDSAGGKWIRTFSPACSVCRSRPPQAMLF